MFKLLFTHKDTQNSHRDAHTEFSGRGFKSYSSQICIATSKNPLVIYVYSKSLSSLKSSRGSKLVTL